MTKELRWTEAEMLEHAARGAGKVDSRGRHGTSRVTYDEIEAMAAVLLLMGLPPISPDTPARDRSPFSPVKASGWGAVQPVAAAPTTPPPPKPKR